MGALLSPVGLSLTSSRHSLCHGLLMRGQNHNVLVAEREVGVGACPAGAVMLMCCSCRQQPGTSAGTW